MTKILKKFINQWKSDHWWDWNGRSCGISGGGRVLITFPIDHSHSQRLSRGKSLCTGRCELIGTMVKWNPLATEQFGYCKIGDRKNECRILEPNVLIFRGLKKRLIYIAVKIFIRCLCRYDHESFLSIQTAYLTRWYIYKVWTSAR